MSDPSNVSITIECFLFQFHLGIKTTQKLKIKAIITFSLLSFIINQGVAQKYASLVGARIGIKTAEFSAKIALDNNNYLEGTVGVVTPQPDYTVGAGAAYHRHVHLNESNTFFKSLKFSNTKCCKLPRGR